MIVPGRGFFLNSELLDFSLSGPNQVEKGLKQRKTALIPDDYSMGSKRPRSGMTPVLVFSKNKRGEAIHKFSLGSPGGAYIPTNVLLVLINLLELEDDLLDEITVKEIISRPRFYSRNVGYWELEADSPFWNFTSILHQRGFDEILPVFPPESGTVNVIGVESVSGRIIAVPDPRRENSLGKTY